MKITITMNDDTIRTDVYFNADEERKGTFNEICMLAEAFVDTLEAFIKEIGLPTTFTEMGIPEETDYKAIADSTVLTGGCAKKFTKTELMEVLLECR